MSERDNRSQEMHRRPETKSFIVTSEFWMTAGAIAAVFIGGYLLNDITDGASWRYGVWIAIAYIVSRGIAKAGSQRMYQAGPRSSESRERSEDGNGSESSAPLRRPVRADSHLQE